MHQCYRVAFENLNWGLLSHFCQTDRWGLICRGTDLEKSALCSCCVLLVLTLLMSSGHRQSTDWAACLSHCVCLHWPHQWRHVTRIRGCGYTEQQQRTVIEIYSQHVANWIKAPFPVTILQGIDHRWRSEWLQSIRHFPKSLMDTIRVTVTERGVICPLKFVMNKPKDALSQYASMLMQPGSFSSSQIVFKRLLVTQFPPDFHACYSPGFLLFYWDGLIVCLLRRMPVCCW